MSPVIRYDSGTGYFSIHGANRYVIEARLIITGGILPTVIINGIVKDGKTFTIQDGGKATVKSLFQPVIEVRIDNGIVNIYRGDK